MSSYSFGKGIGCECYCPCCRHVFDYFDHIHLPTSEGCAYAKDAGITLNTKPNIATKVSPICCFMPMNRNAGA